MPSRKTINVNNFELSYLEQNEKAADTIFFIHGNSGSSNMWQKQLHSATLSKFRMIAFDLPGHGHSGSLPTEKYTVLNFAEILASAIRELATQNPYLVVGFSLGANLTAELLAHDINPVGIVLVGATVFGGAIGLQHTLSEGNNPQILFSANADKKEVETCFRSWCLSGNNQDIHSLINDYFNTDKQFRPSLLASAQQGLFRNEISLLQAYGKPTLVIFGKDETFCNPNYLDDAGLPLWNSQVYRVAGGSHFINVDQPDKVNELLQAYVGHLLQVPIPKQVIQ